MTKYAVEFILQGRTADGGILKDSLAEFGEELEIFPPAGSAGPIEEFKVSIICEEPTLIFDICSQFGRIKTVRVDEIKGGP
ncbi:MAG: hypothetical protein V1925_03570 [Candidatus Omnitrophota bacterium]